MITNDKLEYSLLLLEYLLWTYIFVTPSSWNLKQETWNRKPSANTPQDLKINVCNPSPTCVPSTVAPGTHATHLFYSLEKSGNLFSFNANSASLFAAPPSNPLANATCSRLCASSIASALPWTINFLVAIKLAMGCFARIFFQLIGC